MLLLWVGVDSLGCRKKTWEIQPNFLQQEIADDCAARCFFEYVYILFFFFYRQAHINILIHPDIF